MDARVTAEVNFASACSAGGSRGVPPGKIVTHLALPVPGTQSPPTISLFRFQLPRASVGVVTALRIITGCRAHGRLPDTQIDYK
jgi:hypothetical protein